MLQKQEYENLKNEFDETKDELNKIKQNLAQTQEQAGEHLLHTFARAHAVC
jgi:formiminotetrahydrofolate cyclodeaminase